MGLSFGEIVVLAVIALVVIGPKDLPRLLRSAGKMIGQAKRAISDVKREAGLDEVLRGDFQDLERLADHIEDMGPYRGDDPANHRLGAGEAEAFRAREYPVIGADSTGLLPEDSDVYADARTFSRDVDDAASRELPAAPDEDESREGAHT
ncbi:MAG: Sec-independent protein translocase protein TatB [Polyangiales bacterium]